MRQWSSTKIPGIIITIIFNTKLYIDTMKEYKWKKTPIKDKVRYLTLFSFFFYIYKKNTQHTHTHTPKIMITNESIVVLVHKLFFPSFTPLSKPNKSQTNSFNILSLFILDSYFCFHMNWYNEQCDNYISMKIRKMWTMKPKKLALAFFLYCKWSLVPTHNTQ